MNLRLTAEDQVHVLNGGRVFIVTETSTGCWQTHIVKSNKCWFGAFGTEDDDKETALVVAMSIANLSEDTPLVQLA